MGLAEGEFHPLQRQRRRTGDLTRQRHGDAHQLIGRRDPVHEAPALGLVQPDAPTGIEPFHGDGGRHHGRQDHGGEMGAHAAPGLGHTKEGVVGGDPQIAGERQFATARQRRTIHDGQQRLARVDHHFIEAALGFMQRPAIAARRLVRRPGVLQVRARAKGAARSGDRHHGNVIVHISGDDRLAQGLREIARQGVAPVRAVERQQADPVLRFDLENVGVTHFRFP